MTDVSLDKIRVIKGTPPCAPGQCVICCTPGDQNSKFIDFGFDIDFYGSVYFCENCISQTLALLEYVPADKLDVALLKLTKAQAELDSIKNKYEEVAGVIQHIRDLDIVGLDSTQQPDVVVPVPQVSEVAKSANRKTSSTKSKSSRSTHESGPTGVHNNDSTATDKFEL